MGGMKIDDRFKDNILETEKTVFERFKAIRKVLKIADPDLIEECSLAEIHEMVYQCKGLIYEIAPLDSVKVPYKPSDHREKLKNLGKKAKCVYTCRLGAIVKSDENVERYYLPGDCIDCELCIFDDKTIINLQTKDYVIKHEGFANLMRLFFSILVDKATKV